LTRRLLHIADGHYAHVFVPEKAADVTAAHAADAQARRRYAIAGRRFAVGA
jgi:hypothetical protein